MMHYKFIISLCIIGCAMMACGKQNTPKEPIGKEELTEPTEPAVREQLAVIRLTPEMQEHVFVSPIVDSLVISYVCVNDTTNHCTFYYGDGLVLCNPTGQDSIWADFAQSQLKIAGTNPYILLDNGYAFIDWKWANFHPLSGAFRRPVHSSPKIYDHKQSLMEYSTNFYYMNGVLANEEYYLLPFGWIELTDLTTIWELETGNPIEKPEVRYINIEDILKYSNIKDNSPDIYDINSAYTTYLRNPDNFHNYVENCDRWQAYFVKTLNIMIDNNDFEKWSIQYK